MTGVCSSVKMYENMNAILLGSVVAPEGKTQLSKLGCRDAWVSCRGWDQGDRLPAHSWWAPVRVYVASEIGKEVSWILSESPWRQSPNPTSVLWPELVVHSATWQNWGKCQEQQWGTEAPLLAWSAAQGVLLLIGGLVLGYCGGTTEAHLSFLLEAPLLFYMGTYVTAKEGLDHVKSDYVPLGQGPRIWRSIAVSFVPLVKCSGKTGQIHQCCISTNVCTAGVEI